MNRKMQNPVSTQDIDDYARDGAVVLRGVFDARWCSHLMKGWDRVSSDPHKHGLRTSADEFKLWAGRSDSISVKHLCRSVPEFQDYVQESPAAEIVGRLLQCKEVGFFYDQIFAKAPQSTSKTAWHNDAGGWPVDGVQLPSFWMPLSAVKKESGLEILAGSHLERRIWWNDTGNSVGLTRTRDYCPDYDLQRGNPDYRFLSWDMEPGDVLVVDPYAAHYNAGNHDPSNWRVALSTRWYGDDIFWRNRPECVVAPPGISWDAQPQGQRPGGADFPIIWSNPALTAEHAQALG